MLIGGLGLLLDAISLVIYPEKNGKKTRDESVALNSGIIKVWNGLFTCGAAFLGGAAIFLFGFHQLDAVVAIIAGIFVLYNIHGNMEKTKQKYQMIG